MLHKRREHHGPSDHGAGDHGDSSGRSSHPLVARTLEVLGVQPLSPRIARVTLGGEQLAGFLTAAPTDHVRVFFPERGRAPVLPTVVDGRPQMHAGVDPHRDYTVRAYRSDAGGLDIDIVLHDEGVAVGGGSRVPRPVTSSVSSARAGRRRSPRTATGTYSPSTPPPCPPPSAGFPSCRRESGPM